VSVSDELGLFAPLSPSVAPAWLEPVPDDRPRGRKLLAFGPTLEERLQRLTSTMGTAPAAGEVAGDDARDPTA
jgi:hypothetical protein